MTYNSGGDAPIFRPRVDDDLPWTRRTRLRLASTIVPRLGFIFSHRKDVHIDIDAPIPRLQQQIRARILRLPFLQRGEEAGGHHHPRVHRPGALDRFVGAHLGDEVRRPDVRRQLCSSTWLLCP